METGKYFNGNQRRISALTDADWMAALARCKEHIQWKLRQKTCFGAHADSNLGAEPIDYYLNIAYEKILDGEWEWKVEHSLGDQMIRIVNSHISTEVEKVKSAKGQASKTVYKDIETGFYDLVADLPEDSADEGEFTTKLQTIEAAIAGDEQLEFLFDATKEGKKRAAIADLMEIEPRQFDKLREKLITRVKKYKPSF